MKNKRNKNKEIIVEQKETKAFSFDEMKDIIRNDFGIKDVSDDQIGKVKNIFANKENIQNILSKNSTSIDNIFTLAESYVKIINTA
jgi:hypothetical protein